MQDHSNILIYFRFQYKLNKIFEEMDDKSEVEPEQEH